jgi:IclR family mhp operon transcriptional activator
MKTIRVLERAIAVIRSLDNGKNSLRDIHEETGIDKATILRILLTYQNEGLVYKSLTDNLYRAIHLVAKKGVYSEKQIVMSVLATPILQELQKTIIWPSDISVFHKNKMLLLETTRKFSSVGLNPRYTSGYLIDLFSSAPGRTYFANCLESEKKKIIEHYKKHPPENPRSKAIFRSELEKIIDLTIKDTYGSRDPYFGGAEEDIGDFDDGMDAIAVPIKGERILYGSVSIVWPRKYKLKAKIVASHLNQLKDAANSIAISFDKNL